MPFGALSFVSISLTGYITNKFRLCFPVIAFMGLFPIAGAVCLWKLPRTGTRNANGALLAAYYITSIQGCLRQLFVLTL
jgi:hypothetical protein